MGLILQPQLDARLVGGAQPEEGTSSAPTSAFFLLSMDVLSTEMPYRILGGKK